MNTPQSDQRDDLANANDDVEAYTPLLLAFGPADHAFETEGSDDADAYIVGYN